MHNISLKSYNTFGIEAFATSFFVFKNEADLLTVLTKNKGQKEIFILGGGSNILLTKNLEEWVLKNEIKGKEVKKAGGGDILVTAGGGEHWHDFVAWCVAKNYGGVENLSLIPGTVGASPIQNIGAYGVELKDVFHALTAIHLQTGEKQVFYQNDCDFGYRKSIFKHKNKGEYCITSVTFKLTATNHKINSSYGAIQTILQKKGIKNPTIQDIHKVIIQIRESKLPNPKILGNAGSFFKNPEITALTFQKIKQQFPKIPAYPGQNDLIKIPSAWLIEQCGWKGKRVGETGCYEKQALILVNYGKATGVEVKVLAEEIIASVDDKFGVLLEMEVNLI